MYQTMDSAVANREAKVGKRMGSAQKLGGEIVEEWPWPPLRTVEVPAWLRPRTKLARNLVPYPDHRRGSFECRRGLEIIEVGSKMCLVRGQHDWLEHYIDTADVLDFYDP
jgi:hypothetical protein